MRFFLDSRNKKKARDLYLFRAIWRVSFEPDNLWQGGLCFPATQIAKISDKRRERDCVENEKFEKMKSLQHGVFPGGHPS